MSKVYSIISNYNYGWNLLKCIEACIAQKKYYPDHSVVVVDDGSTDGSKDLVLGAYKFESCAELFEPNRTVYYHPELTFITQENAGASAARNVAIKEVFNQASFFHIVDADDMPLDYKVAAMMEKMADDDVGVVYGDYIIRRPDYNKREFKKSFSREKLLKECIVHSGALIRRSHLEKVLLPNGDIYDTKLHGPASKGFIGCTEDYDLWLRLSNLCLFIHIPEILTMVNEHGKNQSMKMTQEIFNNNMRTILTR